MTDFKEPTRGPCHPTMLLKWTSLLGALSLVSAVQLPKNYTFISFNGAMSGPGGSQVLNAQYFNAGTTPNYGSQVAITYAYDGWVMTGSIPVYCK